MSAEEAELILWRHAEAEDGLNDAARALTRHGRKQAEQVAKWLKARLPKDAEIIVSPAKRTLQTAEPLGLPIRTSTRVGTAASPEDILAEAAWPYTNGVTIVVGHQPTLGKVAALLLTGKASDWSFKKGAVWWFSCRRRGGYDEISLKAVIAADLA